MRRDGQMSLVADLDADMVSPYPVLNGRGVPARQSAVKSARDAWFALPKHFGPKRPPATNRGTHGCCLAVNCRWFGINAARIDGSGFRCDRALRKILHGDKALGADIRRAGDLFIVR